MIQNCVNTDFIAVRRKELGLTQEEMAKNLGMKIEEIYHSHNGIDGYRKMKTYLARRKIKLSPLTVHKYMNTELQLQLFDNRFVRQECGRQPYRLEEKRFLQSRYIFS